MGRHLPPIRTLYQPPYEESVSQEAGEISYTEVGNSARMDKEEGSEEKMLPIHNKSNILSSKQQVGEIYVRSVGSINTKTTSNDVSLDSQYTTPGSSSVKGETDANIQVGEHCFNKARIEKMQPPLGQLRRIYPMGSVAWTKCQFVHPHNISRGSGNNESMLQMSEGNGLNVSCTAHKSSQNHLW